MVWVVWVGGVGGWFGWVMWVGGVGGVGGWCWWCGVGWKILRWFGSFWCCWRCSGRKGFL